jgi:hypothetical protein
MDECGLGLAEGGRFELQWLIRPFKCLTNTVQYLTGSALLWEQPRSVLNAFEKSAIFLKGVSSGAHRN